jgi:hypothetical protein
MGEVQQRPASVFSQEHSHAKRQAAEDRFYPVLSDIGHERVVVSSQDRRHW